MIRKAARWPVIESIASRASDSATGASEQSLNAPGPFARFPVPSEGDRDPDATYAAVGRALTHWELLEGHFATLYNNVVRPAHLARPAQWTFGAPSAVKPTLPQGADVFLVSFPQNNDGSLEEEVGRILDLYTIAASRRNDIAHGIVAPHIPDRILSGNDHRGYFLGPNFTSPKHCDEQLQPEYLYSSKEISEYTKRFDQLGSQIRDLCGRLEAQFQ